MTSDTTTNFNAIVYDRVVRENLEHQPSSEHFPRRLPPSCYLRVSEVYIRLVAHRWSAGGFSASNWIGAD